MRYLVDHGIVLHSQVVLCPTLNDGAHLRRTLDDLLPLSPGLISVAIVPVGLTGHREGLAAIPPVTPDYAQAFIEEYVRLDETYRHSEGGRFVLLSDEWYILAGEAVPPASFYEDLSMEENGVGQVRAFLDRFTAEQARLPQAVGDPIRFTIATGIMASGIFEDYILPRLNTIENLTVDLQVVPNTLLGSPVTVAGLLSGRDFVSHLAGRDLGSAVWATERVLSRADGSPSENDTDGILLDDMTLAQVSERLGVPFNVAGDSLLEIFQRGIRG